MPPTSPPAALGLLETTGLSPAIVALDTMEKSAGVAVLQVELNDFYGVVVKVTGSQDRVAAAIEAGRRVAEQMGGRPLAAVLNRPDPRAWPALESSVEVSPLLEQAIVYYPQESPMATSAHQQALGLIETQGFTAVFAAVDSACKAANVEVLGKEKLGGGYVTVIVRGDVAAVKAAIDAATTAIEGLGKLIAAHVIARPSDNVLKLLPK